MKTKTILGSVNIGASPHDVYEALMDSDKHSSFTGALAKVNREVGGDFTAYDGHLRGKTIELVPDKKIVQEWRAESDDWPSDYFSTAIFLMEDGESGGTQLSLVQAGVPEQAYESIKQGWNEHYWVKMKDMLGG